MQKFAPSAIIPLTSAERQEDEFDTRPKEECGVFGIFAPGEDVARITFFGLFALQHRGQESAGMAVSSGSFIKVHKKVGLVTQVFDQGIIEHLSGISAIGHTRYSTTGGNLECNAQPMLVHAKDGTPIAVAHNGNLVNTSQLRLELELAGCELLTTNDTEVIAHLIARAYDGHIEEAIQKTMEKLEGAYSLTILTPNKVFAVRDPYGIRPLCIGKLTTGHFVIASESCALATIGAEYVREVEPGEVIVIDRSGMTEFQAVPLRQRSTCLLEFIYFARPDSLIYSRTLHTVRRKMGQELAKEHPAAGAHLVIPIPDTGTPGALGYAEMSGTPYGEGVIKSRYIQRTFIQPSQRMRDMGARMKYTPLKDALAGKRIVMVDDSIVRGTTTGKLVRMLMDAGALEVHVRITAPPVKFPCYYGIDMADQKELVAAKNSVEDIRRMIGATSLGYLSLEGAVRAVGMHKSNFCRACFDGKYPIPIPQDVKITKMMFQENQEEPSKDFFDQNLREPALR